MPYFQNIKRHFKRLVDFIKHRQHVIEGEVEIDEIGMDILNINPNFIPNDNISDLRYRCKG